MPTRSEQRRINVQQGGPVNEGLEPTTTDRDRLIELMKWFTIECHKPICKRNEMDCRIHAFEQFADYLLANGVIVLPCEIGQKLYDVTEFFNGCCYPEMYELKENGMYLEKTDKGNIVFTYDGMYIKKEDIGKTVFLTKEEAEQALKGGEE